MRYLLCLLLAVSAYAGDKEKAKATIDAEVAKAEAAVDAACAALEKVQVDAAKRGDVETVAAAQAAIIRVMPNGKVKDGDHNDDGHADNGNSKGGCACGATCACAAPVVTPPVVVPPAAPAPAHVGCWKMTGNGDQFYIFKADGTCTATTYGTWADVDGKLVATWENGYVDSLLLPCDGECLTGKNNEESALELHKHAPR